MVIAEHVSSKRCSRSVAARPFASLRLESKLSPRCGGGKRSPDVTFSRAKRRVGGYADFIARTSRLAAFFHRSAVASAAYRSGDCLVDERQGLEHDCTRRSGVILPLISVARGCGEWSQAEFSNAAGQAKKEARIREWE